MEKIHVMTSDSSLYPPFLAQITDPPQQLYYRGDVSVLQSRMMVSIVGSRKATAYGKEVVRSIVPSLVAQGFITVSGLAFGIDAFVHEYTLACGGRTVGVLGSGVDQITPTRNHRLGERLLASGGVLLSEYPPGTQAYASHFPERNRIIAGLSMATIVVEAAERSGSLITAKHAREYNREVFAVPGSIFSPVSAGTHQLIALGAHPWRSCDLFFRELEYTLELPFAQAPLPQESITLAEQQLLALLSLAPHTMDTLIEESGITPQEVIATVNTLLLKERVRQIDGIYTLITPSYV